jgi:hypothetical protein
MRGRIGLRPASALRLRAPCARGARGWMLEPQMRGLAQRAASGRMWAGQFVGVVEVWHGSGSRPGSALRSLPVDSGGRCWLKRRGLHAAAARATLTSSTSSCAQPKPWWYTTHLGQPTRILGHLSQPDIYYDPAEERHADHPVVYCTSWPWLQSTDASHAADSSTTARRTPVAFAG